MRLAVPLPKTAWALLVARVSMGPRPAHSRTGMEISPPPPAMESTRPASTATANKRTAISGESMGSAGAIDETGQARPVSAGRGTAMMCRPPRPPGAPADRFAMSYLDKIRACNAWEPARYRPLFALGARVGSLGAEVIAILARWPREFRDQGTHLEWTGAPETFDARTERLDEITDALIADGIIGDRHGERYPLTPGTMGEALALIDRAAAPCFGARAFGQHLNGFVRTPGGLAVWVARRAADRRHYPLHLDNLVAGGLPHGIALEENLRKECREEADIPAALADRAVPVGAVSYCRAAEQGLKPDLMFCYDLELPPDFEPRNTDGEVESFRLVGIDELAHLVADTDAFKLNCNLVVIDFLVRHGIIGPGRPDYLAILQGLRAPLP